MRKTENMMSLVGGALLGAAAMYLLDPETGRKRRENLKEHAGDYLDSAGNVLHSGWDKISDRAGDVGAVIADRARDVGSDWSGRAKDAGSGLTDTINEWRDRGRKLWSKYSGKAQDYADAGGDYADNITDYGNRLWNQVRGLGNKLNTRARDAADDVRSRVGPQHSSPVLPVTITAVGCCAMGVGLMYLMDPQRGRARRAWLSDTVSGFVRNTGQTFYRTGKDLKSRMTGSEGDRSQSGPMHSEQLLDLVRSEISRVAPENHGIEVMADVNGSVTLTGSVRPQDADRVIAAVEDVPGVILVINRLEMHSPQNSPGQGVQL